MGRQQILVVESKTKTSRSVLVSDCFPFFKNTYMYMLIKKYARNIQNNFL